MKAKENSIVFFFLLLSLSLALSLSLLTLFHPFFLEEDLHLSISRSKTPGNKMAAPCQTTSRVTYPKAALDSGVPMSVRGEWGRRFTEQEEKVFDKKGRRRNIADVGTVDVRRRRPRREKAGSKTFSPFGDDGDSNELSPSHL